MQRLTIERGPSTDAGTFGIAHLGSTAWNSLELPWRDNQPNRSCVPPGLYVAKVFESPHFGRAVYKLQDVPGRTDVEIHPANWGGDVDFGFYSDLEGCLSIGEALGQITPPGHTEPQAAIERSTPAFDALMALTAGEDIEVDIMWLPEAAPDAQDAANVPEA